MANRDQLSQRELELLQELKDIATRTDALNRSLADKMHALEHKDAQIAALKRELEEYKQKNAQLGAMIHNWRTRMDYVLKQISQIQSK